MTKYGAFKLISIIVLVLSLVAICVWEDWIVTKSLEEVNNYCYAIESAVQQNGGIVNGQVASLVENMEYDWSKYEHWLCYVVNHKSIEQLGVEIVRLKTYIDEEEPIEFYVSLDVIKNYVETFHSFMGASYKNVL